MKHQIYLGIGLILIIVCATFYWVEYRPSRISKSCGKWAIENATTIYDNSTDLLIGRLADKQPSTSRTTTYNQDKYNDYYKRCLREKGIIK
jgi:hypothetical protein